MRYRFEFRRYRLPFRAAVRTAHGVWSEREGVIVRLTPQGNSEMNTAYGEAAPVPGFGLESVDQIEAVCREIGEWVEETRLFEAARGLPCLRSAIVAAQAELGGEVNAEAAGGNPERCIKDNASYLGVAALLPAGKAALAVIEPKAEMGFRVFKWKVGVADIADELVLLDDVCARLPNGAKLRLDANGAWDRRKAERWLERCAERPVEFVEQPAFAGPTASPSERSKIDDMLLGLAGDFPTKIALDESLVSEGDVEKWIGAGWPGIFVVKPSLLGDVAPAMKRLRTAKADVVFSSALETAVGARAALSVAFTWQQMRVSEEQTMMSDDKKTADKSLETKGAPMRALGFGVYPLFQNSRFDGPIAMPFVRWEDVARIDSDAIWKELE